MSFLPHFKQKPRAQTRPHYDVHRPNPAVRALCRRRTAEAALGVRCVIPKLVIITEIIAPYRIPVLNALAESPEIELEVVFLSENDPTLRQWKVYKDEIKFQYHVLPAWRQRVGRYNLLINRGVHSTLSRIQARCRIVRGIQLSGLLGRRLLGQGSSSAIVALVREYGSGSAARLSSGGIPEARFLKLCTAFVVPGKSSFNYLTALGIHGGQNFYRAERG